MQYISRAWLVTFVLLMFVLWSNGCWSSGEPGRATDGNSGYSGGSPASARLSEDEAINAVKALMKAESESHIEYHEDYVTTMCTAQRAEYDSNCRPCAPGSLNYCINEWQTVAKEMPGRCQFPPSENAEWRAEYHASVWEVEASDPYATGLNRWTVNDSIGAVEDGYCVYH